MEKETEKKENEKKFGGKERGEGSRAREAVPCGFCFDAVEKNKGGCYNLRLDHGIGRT